MTTQEAINELKNELLSLQRYDTAIWSSEFSEPEQSATIEKRVDGDLIRFNDMMNVINKYERKHIERLIG